MRGAHLIETRSCRGRDRCVAFVLLVAMAASGVVLHRWHPSSSAVRQIIPDCPTRAWLGLECPGCGSTRAVHHLLHLRLADAWRHNPAMVLLGLPALGLLAAHLASTLIAGRAIVVGFGRRFGIGLTVLLLAYFAARNLPFSFLDSLRPPPASVAGDHDAFTDRDTGSAG